MKRALAAIGTTVIGVVWLITFKVTPLEVGTVVTPAPRPTQTPLASSARRTAAPTPTTLATPGATPADSGTFSGVLVDTRYGPVQVRIVVTGQRIIDVQTLQLPRDRARSAFISQYSAPILRTEAIQAQNARIDIVKKLKA